MAARHAIGTKVYYTGDMANHDGFFIIIGYWQDFAYNLKEIDGKREFRAVQHIANQYSGSCSDRFVTAEARNQYRDASIKEMERAVMRRNYLTKQANRSA